MKEKYYVVWNGFKPGIYKTWEECKKQVEGYSNAKYKLFPSLELAEKAFNNKNFSFKTNIYDHIPIKGICVDAAFNTKTKIMEYQGILFPEMKKIFYEGPFYDATNNIGEFLAIIHALKFCYQNNRNDNIYSDSQTAIIWIQNKKSNTSLKLTEHNSYLFELINQAEKWLREHTYSNKIIKWQTNLYGEIPADFGRK